MVEKYFDRLRVDQQNTCVDMNVVEKNREFSFCTCELDNRVNKVTFWQATAFNKFFFILFSNQVLNTSWTLCWISISILRLL